MVKPNYRLDSTPYSARGDSPEGVKYVPFTPQKNESGERTFGTGGLLLLAAVVVSTTSSCGGSSGSNDGCSCDNYDANTSASTCGDSSGSGN